MKIGASLISRLAEAEGRQQKLDAAAGGVVEEDLVDPNFVCQRQLLEDEAALIVALCTRRAAKSFSLGKRFVRAMRKHPGCSCLYIALTDESAERALWKDVLKVIDRRWKLGAKFNESKLTMTLPNGSVLFLMGMDRDEKEREKLLGGKYAEVAIDEAQSYRINLEDLVFNILKPAVADYRGTIGLYGTPGNVKRGLFFELTNGHDPSTPHRYTKMGFSGHCWNTFANPYMVDNWRAEISDLIAANPLIEQTPGFQQNYLGRWVIDDSMLVYRYLAGRNDFDGNLPFFPPGIGSWHFVLSIDLGFTDATSFTVAAYHDHCRDLFFVTSKKIAGLDITGVALHAHQLKASFPIEVTVIDGANKQAVEELNNRHDLGAVPTDKTGKADFIDIMNAEFIQGRVKLGPDCAPLREELLALVWDERKLLLQKREEHPSCENHCTDGALYSWRWCWQYLSKPLKEQVKRGTPQWYAEQQQQAQKEVEEAFEQQFEANLQRQQEDAFD